MKRGSLSTVALLIACAALAACDRGGTSTISSSQESHKETICHLTSSETNPMVIITVGAAAVPAHLRNHGDGIWACSTPQASARPGDGDPNCQCCRPEGYSCEEPTIDAVTGAAFPCCAGLACVGGICRGDCIPAGGTCSEGDEVSAQTLPCCSPATCNGELCCLPDGHTCTEKFECCSGECMPDPTNPAISRCAPGQTTATVRVRNRPTWRPRALPGRQLPFR
jgi:hypothetical protein